MGITSLLVTIGVESNTGPFLCEGLHVVDSNPVQEVILEIRYILKDKASSPCPQFSQYTEGILEIILHMLHCMS